MRNSKGQFVKGHKTIITEEMKDKISLANKGRKRTPEFVEAMKIRSKGKHFSPQTEFKKGQKNYWEGKKRPEIQDWLKDVQFQKGHIPHNAGKPYFQIRGAKHWNWKGGINPINDNIRHSLEIKLWRIAVFTRDDYTCQICDKRGGNLEADHIKPFALYPELRTSINNGRTLCKSCHRNTQSYGDLRNFRIKEEIS